MSRKNKKNWKSRISILLVLCMVLCALGGYVPAQTVQAETEQAETGDKVTHTVTLGVGKDYFLCNKIPASGPVTFTYTVKSGAVTSGTVYGVVASAYPDERYPYNGTNGAMMHRADGNGFLTANAQYSFTMSKDTNGLISCSRTVVNNGVSGEPTMPYTNENQIGNADSQYFGFYFASIATEAQLINVTCTDAAGNNLGLRVQTGKTNYSITRDQSEEDYTYLSFWDYEVLNKGDALVSPVTSSTQGITGAAISLDKVLFTGEITFNGTGLREHAFTIGGSYDGTTDYTWHGICLYTETGTSLRAWNWYTNEAKTVGTITPGEPNDISIRFDEWSPGWWDVTYVVNDAAPITVLYHLTDGADFGPYICITPAGTPLEFSSVLGENPIQQMEDVSYDLADGDYLVAGNVTITDENNASVVLSPENPVLSEAGDYNIVRREGSFRRSQRVSLYEIGDVNLDGNLCDGNDFTALQELLIGVGTGEHPDCAAEYAADLDNDELFGASDLKLMEDILDTATDTTLEKVLEKYHVPALTYDYLGGDEVMPIVGFNGPYQKGAYNYLTEEVFETVKAAGINLINFAPNAIGESGNLQALKAISLAEQKGIGYYVDDFNLNPEYDALLGLSNADATVDIPWGSEDAPTISEIASLYGKASFYENSLGVHVADEPYPNSSVWDLAIFDADIRNKQLKYYDWISRTLNQYCNTSGFMNLTSAGADIYTYSGTPYTTFCSDVLEDTEAKVLAFDAYPFSSGRTIDNQSAYLNCLDLTRQFALSNQVPFWGYVAAGGDFRDEKEDDPTDSNKLPTEAETYWNVNTMLAFGAKGIAWFPLVQPSYFALDGDGYDYDRNGLIGADNGLAGADKDTIHTTPFYPWAQNINRHIVAVDEVLMKSTSAGIMACGSNTTQALSDGDVPVEDSVGYLEEVSTKENNQYGAIVGCFDYRDANAYYVVNYDVANGQEITLSLAKECDYYYIQNATRYSGFGSEITLTMDAGEGVLVVVEEEEVGEEASTFYSVTMGEGKRYFVCNNLPTNGPVTLTYTVESSEILLDQDGNPTTNGAVATAYRDVEYPYDKDNGSMVQHSTVNRFLRPGYTYTTTMSLGTDNRISCVATYIDGDGNPGTSYLPDGHRVGNGNASSQYFGVYFSNVTAARLVNITCTDAEGNDLGVYVKALTGDYSVGEAGKVIEYTVEQYEEVKGNPVKAGYLFAGWFSDKKCTSVLTEAPADGYVYGKFVVNEVLTVKAQVTPSTDADSAETAIRFVTTVDSLDYQEVGFYISIGGGETKKKTLKKVYGSLVVVDTNGNGTETDTTVAPSEFCPASLYFATYAYWGVPKAHFGTAFKVTPYWKTLDGTEVCGKSVTKTVSMYYNQSVK